MLLAVPFWEVDEPGTLLISNGLATMGFALPAAIAAALVEPDRHVVCFTGDGGLGMTLAELETLARLDLPVVVVVFNDSTLSLIAAKQSPQGHGGDGAVRYRTTDFAAIARGCGMSADSVDDVETFDGLMRAALARVVVQRCSTSPSTRRDTRRCSTQYVANGTETTCAPLAGSSAFDRSDRPHRRVRRVRPERSRR